MSNLIACGDEWIDAYNSTSYYGYGSSSMPNVAMTGSVMYDNLEKTLKVFNGGSWTSIQDHLTVRMNPRAAEILKDAERRMVEDNKLQSMAKSNPVIAEALADYNIMSEKLRVLIALCDEGVSE